MFLAVMYPSLGRKSVTTIAAGDLPKSYTSEPIYAHHFALRIYNMYLTAKDQIAKGNFPIDLGHCRIPEQHLQLGVDMLVGNYKTYEQRDARYNCDGRGFMASSEL